MQISKVTEYAVLTLVQLALEIENQPITAESIAESRGLPVNLMPQLAATLRREGWVQGKRGPGGGLMLVADPSSISVADVIKAMEGPVALRDCLLQPDSCPNQRNCPLHDVWREAQQKFLQSLAGVTIADLRERFQ